ncbi:C4-dicarboxylate transporter DctM subunit [Bradyrhizobium sp. F1.13.4]
MPLFILMGELLFRTRLSRSLFQGLAPWAGLLPGRLLHVNVIGCTIFAAISGSSAATTQVIGRMSLNELTRRGYSRDIAIGSLAGAGTLGFLIPPSNIMIIYGVLGDVSILKLFTAGVLPGLLLAATFMGWVMLHTTLNPGMVPETEAKLSQVPWRERFAALKDLAPALFLIACVLGSMYGGLATPSEAAAVGVFGAALVAWAQGSMSQQVMRDVLIGSVVTCSMIALIVLGASILGNAAAFLGIPQTVAAFVKGLGLSPFMLIVVLILFYLILGCFLDGFSMIVMTLPIVLPIVKGAGFDEIWFGIFLVLAVEMAQITPPVGFNLFVIQGPDRRRPRLHRACHDALSPHHGRLRAAADALARHRHDPPEGAVRINPSSEPWRYRPARSSLRSARRNEPVSAPDVSNLRRASNSLRARIVSLRSSSSGVRCRSEDKRNCNQSRERSTFWRCPPREVEPFVARIGWRRTDR